MITLGKQGTLHARRRAATLVRQQSVLKKLFDEIAPRYASRQGGYTRVVKLGRRHGDAAPLSLVELVDRPGAEAEQAGQKKKRRREGGKAQKATPEPRRRAAAG
jgi:large subunit ribosomal protein L17